MHDSIAVFHFIADQAELISYVSRKLYTIINGCLKLLQLPNEYGSNQCDSA